MTMKFAAALVCLIALTFAVPELAIANDRPLRSDSGLTAAEELITKGNYSAALEYTTIVLNRHPRDADAYTYRGLAYYRLGQTDKARECFETALQIDPAHLGANKYTANLYIDEGKVDRALEQLQAMRIICGKTECAEVTILEAEINKGKAEKQ